MTKNNQQQLTQATTERKHHVKLYKAGKLWLAAGITTAAMGIAAISGGVVANADSTGEPTTSETTPGTVPYDSEITSEFTPAPENQGDPQDNGSEQEEDQNVVNPENDDQNSDEATPNDGSQTTNPSTDGQDAEVNNNDDDSEVPSNEGESDTDTPTTTDEENQSSAGFAVAPKTADDSTLSDSDKKINDDLPADGKFIDTTDVNLNDASPESINPVTDENLDSDALPVTINYVDKDSGKTVASITGNYGSSALAAKEQETLSELLKIYKQDPDSIIQNDTYDIEVSNDSPLDPDTTSLKDVVDDLTTAVQQSISSYNANHPNTAATLINVVDGQNSNVNVHSDDGRADIIYQVVMPDISDDALKDAQIEIQDGLNANPNFNDIIYLLDAYDYELEIAIHEGTNYITGILADGSKGAAAVFSKLANYGGNDGYANQLFYLPKTYTVNLTEQSQLPSDVPGGSNMVYTKTQVGTPLFIVEKSMVPDPVFYNPNSETPTTPNDTTPSTPTPDTVTNVPTAPTTPSDVVPSTPEGDMLTETPTTPDNNDVTPAGPSADTLTPTADNGNQTTTTTAGDTTPTTLTTSSNAQVETPNSAATPTKTAAKAATLPQTSEQHTNGLAILGLALLGGLLGLVAPRRRHN